MKKQLFLILLLFFTNMQIAGAGAAGDGAETKDNELPEGVTGEDVVEGATAMVSGSWSQPDRNSPYITMGTEVDADGYVTNTKTEQTLSSQSTPFDKKTTTFKSCASSKCNPSKKSEENSQDSNKNEQGSSTQSTNANKQAEQQITNNNNNMANKLANQPANTVVVVPPPPPPPPPDPCIADPLLCGPIVDPCILDPVACGP